MELLLWAVIAFAISIAAGWMGWTGVAGKARTVARWLFAIFLILALLLVLAIAFGISIVV
ncbi:MAG: DUF1328 family protein [Thiohalomonadaceae bacterium]